MKKYKLGELMEVTRGMSLCGEYYATEGDLMRLTLGNFDYRNNCFKDDKSKDNLFFSGDVKDEFILNKGDIITPLTEQAIGLLGSTAKVPCSGKYIQSQDVGLIKCNEKLHPDFAFYLIPSKLVRNQLSAAAQQTKIRHTSPDKIKSCMVWIPEYSKQEEIGKLLSTLDDKIALNRRMNAKLEQMAKRLYEHWFVQFDFPVSCHSELVSESHSEEMLNQVQHDERIKPYKSSGGKMVWNETLKREIPAGWEVVCFADFIEIGNGKDHSKLPTGNIPVYGSGGFMRGVTNFLYDGESVLFPRKGTLNNIMYKNEKIWTVDTMFYSKMKISHSAIYVYYTAKQFDFVSMNTGTGVPSMTSVIIKGLPIIKPTQDILDSYDESIQPIYKKIHQNEKETQKLTALRDKLLPLLMNGQVEVK